MYLHIPTTMAFRRFMDGHYYLMDDISFLYIIRGILDGYFCINIARQYIQMAFGHALLWSSLANPFRWMTAA